MQSIKLDKDKCYLVNLNSDPSLSELLVYYLKKVVTKVGRSGDPSNPDIQLSGIGIHSEHCEIHLKSTDDDTGETLTLIPHDGARTCINGVEIHMATLLSHGDRILWGSNHFFRVNCPGSTGKTTRYTLYSVRTIDPFGRASVTVIVIIM